MIQTTKTNPSPPSDRSFIEVLPHCDFPIQNLPYGVFVPTSGAAARVGVAIGDFVLDLSVLADAGLLGELAQQQRYFSDSSLNRFMGHGKGVWSATRARIRELLSYDCPTLRDNTELRSQALSRINAVTLQMPIQVAGYTDFYSSIDHARNVGTIIRGADKALNENWRYIPIGYDGRAGSVCVSGTNFHRPMGQSRPADDAPPVFGPERALDFELELGFIVGVPGTRIPTSQVDEHVFGVVLLNDCSARAIQKWEYQPLGPFLGKNFGTVISPWVVPLEALERFKVKGCAQDPEPFEYLKSSRDVFDISLEVALRTATMPAREEYVVTRSNAKHLYWDHYQQLAHHTVNGCQMSTGDIYATGTISGPTPDSLGCLLERTKGGKEPLNLPTGEERRYLQDGDTVTMRGFSQGDGYRIGFGEVTTTVLPALEG
jgi:fumarylacetoacetase